MCIRDRLEGVEGAKPEWNFSQQVEQSEGGYQTHYWIQAYTGRYQPRDVRKVSGNVTDQNNGNQVYQSFTINQVSSNIEAVSYTHLYRWKCWQWDLSI